MDFIRGMGQVRNDQMLQLCHLLNMPASCEVVQNNKAGALISVNNAVVQQYNLKSENEFLGLSGEEASHKTMAFKWPELHFTELKMLGDKVLLEHSPQLGEIRGIPRHDGTLTIQRLVKIPLYSDTNSKKIVGIFSANLAPTAKEQPSILQTLQHYLNYYGQHKRAIHYFLLSRQCLHYFLTLPTLRELKALILVANTNYKCAGRYLNISESTVANNIEKIKNQRLLSSHEYENVRCALNIFKL